MKKITTILGLSMLFLLPSICMAQQMMYEDAVSSGTIWHSAGAEISNPASDAINSTAICIANNGMASWEETQIFPDTYTIVAGDNFYISFYNPNGAINWQLKMDLSVSGTSTFITGPAHVAAAATGWHQVEVDLTAFVGEDITKITIYPSAGESKTINYDQIYVHDQSLIAVTPVAGTYFFEDAVSSGTIWHSAGSEISNPASDAINSTAVNIANNGMASWEETQIFPDTYTIVAGDNFYISFYNPNGAIDWQLKMDLSVSGISTFVTGPAHTAASATGWDEVEVDLTAFVGEDITKVTIYPSAGESKIINYDQIYVHDESLIVVPVSGTYFFEDAVSSGTIWHSAGSEISNPASDAINSTAVTIANNGMASWEETQIFPDTYTIESGDNFYISFYNPNGALDWQLKMDLSVSGVSTFITGPAHTAASANGWHEVAVDLTAFVGEDITKVIIYPAAGESKIINYDQIYVHDESLVISTVTWTGTTDTDWAIVTNWDTGVAPGSGDKAVVPVVTNQPVISGDVEVYSLDISAAAEVNVTTGASLTLLDALVATTGAIHVASGGSLLTNGTVSGTSHTFTRSTTFDESTGRYSVVGSPVSGETTDVLGSLIYAYDESITFVDGSERFIAVASAETMAVGNAYFSAYTGDVVFTGTPNTGDIAVSIATAGFNLISNPYPAAISYDDFVVENGAGVFDGTIYLWDDGGSNAGQRTNSDYITANSIGTASAGSSRSADWNGYIGSGQGFIINTGSNTSDVSFTNAMKSTGNNLDAAYFRTQSISSFETVKLNLTGADELHYETLIGFSELATSGIDPGLDAKQVSFSDTKFYSLVDGQAFAIQGLPWNSPSIEVDMGFEVPEVGTYSINLQELTNWDSNSVVIIMDHLLDVEQVLTLSEASYSFSTSELASESRFSISMKKSSVLAIEDNVSEIGLVAKINGLSVIGSEWIGTEVKVSISDLSGKVLLNKAVQLSAAENTVNFDFDYNRVYILNVRTARGVTAKKIVFQ